MSDSRSAPHHEHKGPDNGRDAEAPVTAEARPSQARPAARPGRGLEYFLLALAGLAFAFIVLAPLSSGVPGGDDGLDGGDSGGGDSGGGDG
jgi:hypothetical protein